MGGTVVALASAGLWLGILLAGGAPLGPGESIGLLLAGLAGLGMAAAARRPRRAVALAAAVICFGLLGWGWGGLRSSLARASPLVALDGRAVQVVGTVASDTAASGLGWHLMLNARTLMPDEPGWPDSVALHDGLWVSGDGYVPHLEVGDRVSVEGTLGRATGDFGAYLTGRDVEETMSAGELRRLGTSTSPAYRLANAARRALSSSIERVLPAREGGLLMGLTIGDTSRMDPRVDETFRATGLTHLLAVSGENVALFLAPILGLATWLGLGRRWKFAVGLAAVGFFMLLTRAEPSVMRASAMAALAMLGTFLGRPRSPPALIGGAVILLLGLDPTLVSQVGFQLSVAATAGIALLAGPIAGRLSLLPKPLALAAGTTLGAQIGVTPLILHQFGLVPTITIVANLLAAPAVGPAMFLGLAAAGGGMIWTPLGTALGVVGRLPLDYLEEVASRLAHAPAPVLTMSGGHAWQLLLGLGGVAAAAWWIRSGRALPRKAILGTGAMAVGLMWLGAIGAGRPGALTVTFLDVGQGDSALVRSPGGALVLIDGGPDEREVATKLAALGVHHLDLMVATHQHADHVAGLPAVLARLPVGLVVDPGCRGDSPYYAAFLRAVAGSRVPFRHPRPGAVIAVDDLRFRVLAPDHCFVGTDSDPNNDSIVLLMTELGVSPATASVLFTGDAQTDSQTDMLRDEASWIHAVVLKVPHHGGDTSLHRFIDSIGARVAVVSVGQPNLYGHPVPAVLRELTRDGMRVFRTDRSGDVTVTFGPSGVSVQSSHG